MEETKLSLKKKKKREKSQNSLYSSIDWMKTDKWKMQYSYLLPFCKSYYSKNNKYIITAFRIMMLRKRTTLNKLLYNSGLKWKYKWRNVIHFTRIKPQWLLRFVKDTFNMVLHFQDGGSYHIETSSLICYANQWTGFYMIGSSIIKELNWKKL